jgi:hypothetical protein
MVELREEIKSIGGRDFMARLEQLRISYEKARYWMAKIEGKPTDRHKKDAQETHAFDWDVALDRLEALKNDVHILKQSKPIGGGILVAPLSSLADLLGYQVVTNGGGNA